MSLCTPTRCGCSITSDTLSVVNYGDVINIEVAAAANSYPTFNFLDAAERDSELTSPMEGWEAWLRSTNQKTRYSGTAWRVIFQPRTVFTITPAMLVAGGSAVVIGSGSLTCFYSRSGDEVFYNGRYVFGAGSVAGAGFVGWPTPVPCAVTNRNVGEAGMYDTSTNIIHPVQVEIGINGMVAYIDSGTNVFYTTATYPFTWAVGDEFWWNTRYPAA